VVEVVYWFAVIKSFMKLIEISIGENFPEKINAVIEIPKGTSNKYEYDEKTGSIKLDRVLHSSLHYPVDYGFIPQTRAEDGDPGDVLVLTDSPVFSGCILEVRPIGLLKMTDENGKDNKVLAVPIGNPHMKNIKSINDVQEHVLKEITHFFEQYKVLEEKFVKVDSWGMKEDAIKLIETEHRVFLAENKHE